MSGRAPRRQIDEDMPAEAARHPGWGKPRRSADPASARIPAKRITINLDQDVIAHFKGEALRGGPPYQVAINQALRRFLHEQESREEGALVERIMTVLDDARVRRKIRGMRGAARERPGARERPSPSRTG